MHLRHTAYAIVIRCLVLRLIKGASRVWHLPPSAFRLLSDSLAPNPTPKVFFFTKEKRETEGEGEAKEEWSAREGKREREKSAVLTGFYVMNYASTLDKKDEFNSLGV
jgi:hypothetical protein